MNSKQIAPAAVVALKEALTNVYWYKSDLRSFLTSTLQAPQIIAQLNWDDFKRNIVATIVDFLVRHEDKYQSHLLRLMTEVAKIDDFSHLERLEDGKDKAKRAKESVIALRKLTIGHKNIHKEQEEIEERRKTAYEALVKTNAVKQKLEEITREYYQLLTSEDAQQRGYRLEKIIKQLFDIFDLDPKAAFKTTGEQLDGAFSFEGTDYLFEGKWQKDPVKAEDLDSLASKLARKLDNTLGLFLSINGFSNDGISAHSSGKKVLLLMDGSDLMAVLEGRIDLIQLLLRKRRHASQTGNIYLRIHEIF